MDIDITTTIETDPEPTMGVLVRGGLRITVDGQRLNAYVDEATGTWLRDWYPEYVGEMPLDTLGELFQTLTAILKSEQPRYEPERVLLPETSEAFVCEFLGDESLRIAFQTARNPGPDADVASPQSACGVAVPVGEFATELLACGDDVLAVLDDIGLDDATVENFREAHVALRDELADL